MSSPTSQILRALVVLRLIQRRQHSQRVVHRLGAVLTFMELTIEEEGCIAPHTTSTASAS